MKVKKNHKRRRAREYFPVPMNPRRSAPESSSAACVPSPSVPPSERFATNSGGAETVASETCAVVAVAVAPADASPAEPASASALASASDAAPAEPASASAPASAADAAAA